MAAVYVFSTLSTDMAYTGYDKSGNDLPVVDWRVFIRGKANINIPNLVTPRGVMTAITEEELGLLKKNDVFNLHVKNGFITYESKKADADEVADDMKDREKSAPLIDSDYDPDKSSDEKHPILKDAEGPDDIKSNLKPGKTAVKKE